MDERYPIGRFRAPDPISEDDRRGWLEALRLAPARLRDAVAGLDDAQLDTPYRDGGWTLRQVVHHLPDSHLNSYARFKLALTEDAPVIKPYQEARWAELPDSRAPVEVSLALLEALHERWLALLVSLSGPDWQRTFVHPESGREVTLERTLALYAWHGAHHTAQITGLRERKGW